MTRCWECRRQARKTVRGAEQPPLTVFFRGVEGKLFSGRQCPACNYEEYDQVPANLKDISDLPVRDLDAEAAEAGKELFDQVSGGSKMRVPEKVVMTETPYSNDNRRRDSWKEPQEN